MWDVIVLIPALGFFFLTLLCSDSYCSLVVAHVFRYLHWLKLDDTSCILPLCLCGRKV